MRRASGVLLHISSLPGDGGIGAMGAEARAWIDFLSSAGQTYWQLLPLGPTGFGNSPYQCYSAFAGNPLFIDLYALVEEGLLEGVTPIDGDENCVDFETVISHSRKMLEKAFKNFTPTAAYKTFCTVSSQWLEDYVLFMALMEHFEGLSWSEWPDAYKHRHEVKLEAFRKRASKTLDFHRFVQFYFFKQYSDLKRYAKEKGIAIIGDLPIYVAQNSADVWSRPELFLLDEDLNVQEVAGVPPDYFSATGQRWGNPLFDWKAHETEKFAWWIERLKSSLELYDRVRIDHFRGFEAYWAIPAEEETAVNGSWRKAPGKKLFEAFEAVLGKELPIIAEDLGIITPEVEALRDAFNLPGMKVLQFAFGSDATNPYLPHNHTLNSVVYTGTHDNDTTNGWFYEEAADDAERVHAMNYLDCGWDAFHHHLNRTALASTANLTIIPLQDLLGLGSDARMNIPGTVENNWKWRVSRVQLKAYDTEQLKKICQLYGR